MIGKEEQRETPALLYELYKTLSDSIRFKKRHTQRTPRKSWHRIVKKIFIILEDERFEKV